MALIHDCYALVDLRPLRRPTSPGTRDLSNDGQGIVSDCGSNQAFGTGDSALQTPCRSWILLQLTKSVS
jgi:hypothetical protein